MNNNENIIFKWEGEKIEDYNYFLSSVEKSINNIPKTIRKKLIFCLIELVQNAIVHKNKSKISVIISKGKSFVLQVANISSKENAIITKHHFEQINKHNLKILKEIYNNNLKKESNNKSVGNGLILCLIKSEKKIELIINNITDIQKQILFKIYFDYE